MLIKILSLMLISPFALASSGNEQASLMSTLPMLVMFAFATYFMIIRPQQTQQKNREKLISSIKEGVEVSAGGIIGTVEKVDDQFAWVTIATNVTMKIQRTL